MRQGQFAQARDLAVGCAIARRKPGRDLSGQPALCWNGHTAKRPDIEGHQDYLTAKRNLREREFEEKYPKPPHHLLPS